MASFYSPDEQAFFERNCPTCVHNDLNKWVLDRLAGRELSLFKCKFPSGKVMTYQERLNYVHCIGYSPRAEDCPKYERIKDVP